MALVHRAAAKLGVRDEEVRSRPNKPRRPLAGAAAAPQPAPLRDKGNHALPLCHMLPHGQCFVLWLRSQIWLPKGLAKKVGGLCSPSPTLCPQLHPLAAGIGGFCAALSGYFLLLPLRDEAGVALGTDKLPRLFLASLCLTFLATPLASAFLNRSPARERGLQLLFRALSLSVLGERFFR